MNEYLDEFSKTLVCWFGGIVEYWASPKTMEYHFFIRNADIGYYYFTVPFEKIEWINDTDFTIHLVNDYLATMKIKNGGMYGL